MDSLPRLKGREAHRIEYRHIIDSLVRKPGAFAAYRYREDLNPTTTFRLYYDLLVKEHGTKRGVRQNLRILQLAAGQGEAKVVSALRDSLQEGHACFERVEMRTPSEDAPDPVRLGQVPEVHLPTYDSLLSPQEGGAA